MSHHSDRTRSESNGSDRWEDESPQADRLDQERDVEPEPDVEVTEPSPSFDGAEADAADVADQHAEVPLDEDRR